MPPERNAAQRHVRGHVACDGVAEQRIQFLNRLGFVDLQRIGLRGGDDLGRIPVTGDPGLTPGSEDQQRPGQQLVKAAKDAVRRRYVPPAHVGGKTRAVDLRRPARMGSQPLDLGGEQKQLAESAPEQRLDSQAVAGQRQGPLRRSQTAKANMPLTLGKVASTPQVAQASTSTSVSEWPRKVRPEAANSSRSSA